MGETLKYYRLLREERIKTEYCKIIQEVVQIGKKVTYVKLIGVLGSGKTPVIYQILLFLLMHIQNYKRST